MNPLDTTRTTEMRCPHCGYEHRYPEEHFGGADLAVVTCEYCDDLFDAEWHLDGLFSTSKYPGSGL